MQENNLQNNSSQQSPEVYAFPASYGQQQLWFLHQLDPNSAVYNIPFAFRLKGNLNIPVLERSINEIIRRHETFRTVFTLKDGSLTQLISSSLKLPLEIFNFSALDEKEKLAKDKIHKFTLSPFNLENGPLIRAGLIILDSQEHILLLSFHHTILDHTAVISFFNELTACYNHFSEDKKLNLPKPAIQYADMVIWQNDEKQVTALRSKLDYWKNLLKDQESFLGLPADKPRPASQTFNGIERKVSLPKELSEKVRELSRKEKKSFFMVLLTAYNIFLYRYSGKTDITVGCPFANRNQPGLEEVMGCCMNTLPLRTTFSPEDSFLDVLNKVRDVTLGAQANQEVSFEQIVEELHPVRDASFNPLFQVSFMFQEPLTTFPLNGVECKSVEIKSNTSRFDLTFWMWDSQDGLQGLIQYNTDLFEDGTIDRMFNNFSTLLEDIIASPLKKVSDIEILSGEEKELVLYEWNNTNTNYPDEKCIHHLFKDAVKNYPDKIAVRFENQNISYQQLNERAEKIKQYLLQSGIRPGSAIGIFLDRSIEMVAGLLAVLKAGCAYVPLDPSFPKERLEFILGDADIRTIITQKKLSGFFSEYSGMELCLDHDWEKNITPDDRSVSPEVSSRDIAYIIYTSGSTGKPKGVQIEHKSFVNFLLSMKDKPGISRNDTLLAVTTLSFDIAGLEIFLPLISGARLLIASKEKALNGKALLKLIESEKISIMQATPATYRLMITGGWKSFYNIKLLCGGEPLPADLAAELISRSDELWNMYGPTETTVWSSVKRIDDASVINIGKPIYNTAFYILDKNLKPVPVGVTGELCIGGDGLALGYHNRPELTQKVFISHSIDGNTNTKIYRTGDLARFKTNGDVDCLGRIDNQVKVRGFRIEPGEIETALSEIEYVKQSVVAAKNDSDGNARLVAYLELDKNNLPVDENTKSEHLSEWQYIWDDTYKDGSHSSDPFFNISGWKSSYTGEQIPPDEMQEWVDNTVERILEFQPKNILEIGCGTGLLLFRLASACNLYTGIDFSQSVLDFTNKAVQAKQLKNVTLMRGKADEVDMLTDKQYDLIIINSVIQYFPGIDYLESVIKKASGLLTDGGKIYIGDVRNYGLLHLFAMTVELEKSGEKISASEFLTSVQNRIDDEEELTIDPAYFTGLKNILPDLTGIAILLKKGKYVNELTKYRYDVVLTFNGHIDKVDELEWFDYSENSLTVSDIESVISSDDKKTHAFSNIPDGRIFNEIKLRDLVNRNNNNSNHNFRTLINKAIAEDISGVNPDNLFRIAEKYNYSLYPVYSGGRRNGYFNAVFKPENNNSEINLNIILNTESNFSELYNNPLIPKYKRNILPGIKEYLKGKLPDYMIPSLFMILNELPLTPNGKIDRKSLPEPEFKKSEISKGYIPPSDETEKKLVAIWEKTLGVKPIGTKDNFFDLGGHSLLAAQLFAKIEQEFGISIPLAVLFQSQTIEALTQIINQKNWKPEWSCLVPIKPEGAKPPLFLVHGAEGNVLLYRELAKYLDDDQPVYGLQSKGIDGMEEMLTRFEDMALEYKKEIKQLQPEGPYYLGGYCLGGAIAYEIAQQFTSEGDQVALLAMLETYNIKVSCDALPVTYKFFHKFQNIYYHLKNILAIRSDDKSKFIIEKLSIETSRLKVKWHIAFSKLAGRLKLKGGLNFHHLMIDKVNDTAQEMYQPVPYSGKVVLYKPLGQFKGYNDPQFGWKSLVKGELKTVNMPFYLRGMLVDPYVRILAKKLSEELKLRN